MPAVPTIATGGRLTPARLMFMQRRPVAILRQGVAQAISNGGNFTPVTLDLEIEDTDPDGIGGHSGSSSRYTCRYPGVYLLGGGVGFAPNATGARGVGWLINGTVLDDVMLPAVTTASTASRIAARTTQVRLAEGDYVELGAFQNSGGSLNTSLGSAASSMHVTWVRL
ncbi:hypothetical protein ABZ793_06225 [Micromonospora sp. NPDC047465]|uniref:hypothetical protein n=1 Tax=Micromonospora sp. NPDC047465 TaxID=3154813 RepID=UPI0033D332A6